MASVCREISKLHEEANTQPLSALIADYESRSAVKGEIVIVVEGIKSVDKMPKEKNRRTNKYRD